MLLIGEITIWNGTEIIWREICVPVVKFCEVMEETLGERWLLPHISDCYSACVTYFSIIICAIIIFTTACRFRSKFY
jgi:hypothetical protein